MSGGPLSELRVLDFSNSPAGSLASQTLADFGAEVIHVEPPGGSPLRGQAGYALMGRGKESLVLDLREEADRELARTLASGADVVLETFRPGVMERWGLGYESLSKVNPRLVFGSVTGFGRVGPYAAAKGYESLIMARMGALFASQQMVSRPGPAHVSVPYASYAAGQILLSGVLAALHERDSSGIGQRVDTSLLKGLASLGTWNWYLNLITSKYPDAFTAAPPLNAAGVPQSPMIFMLMIGLSKDGRWMQFSQVQLHLYTAMLRAMGLEWMMSDDEWKAAVFADGGEKTSEYWDRMFEAVKAKSLPEWQAIFEQDHDVWAETMRRGSELLDHPQMQHLGAVTTIEDSERGPVRQPGPIVHMSATPAMLVRGAPPLDSAGPRLRSRPWSAQPAPAPTGSQRTLPGGHEARPPLDGVTILELGTFFAGPFGSTVLREMGARVIKVEPLEGDPIRNLLPFPEVAGAKVTQGKESIAVDLSSDEGRRIVHSLSARSDMVLQSFRAGVAARQGIDADTLRAINPQLIYLNSPGYGVDGPCGDRPAYAPTIGAGSGLARRNVGSSVPERADLTIPEIRANAIRLSGAATTEYAQADGISALTAASALALGLVARDRVGCGQEMLTTMLTSVAHALFDDMVEYAARPLTAEPDQDLYGYSALYRLYEGNDGWIYLAAPTAADWSGLRAALAPDIDLGTDERFADPVGRRTHDSELAAVLAGVFRTRPAQYWEDRLLSHDIGCVVAHPEPPEVTLQSKELGGASELLVEVEHPTFGEHLRLVPYADFSRSPSIAGPSCLCGQHTDVILAELGMDDEAIADLRARKIVS